MSREIMPPRSCGDFEEAAVGSNIFDTDSEFEESNSSEVEVNVDINQIALRRLKLELSLLMQNVIEGCKVQLIHDNLFEWLVTLDGAKDTPYEGGRFLLRVVFPPSYPFDGPRVEFLTRIYHCNVRNNRVCENNWCPTYSIGQLLLSIRMLMVCPDLENAVNQKIAKQFESKRKSNDKLAREWTNRYAK